MFCLSILIEVDVAQCLRPCGGRFFEEEVASDCRVLKPWLEFVLRLSRHWCPGSFWIFFHLFASSSLFRAELFHAPSFARWISERGYLVWLYTCFLERGLLLCFWWCSMCICCSELSWFSHPWSFYLWSAVFAGQLWANVLSLCSQHGYILAHSLLLPAAYGTLSPMQENQRPSCCKGEELYPLCQRQLGCWGKQPWSFGQ